MKEPLHMNERLQEMRLVIVSHVTHYRFGNQLFAYGPYAQEIDLWADLFRQVTIAAPFRQEAPPGDCLPFTRNNISIAPQIEAGGETLGAKIKLACVAPRLMVDLARAMWRADAIHVRCPGNLGLLGAVLAPLFSKRLVAKYAAQWSTSTGEVWSSRWQKAVLRSRWWRGPVTVYGEWPDQPPQVIPFFTSLLTTDHMERARIAAKRTWNGKPLRVLFAGRLSKPKNVDVLLRAIARNRQAGLDVRCTIVGEGPQREPLERLMLDLGISDAVEFAGGIGFEDVIRQLEKSDVLALVSEAEGWPKAIAEGMAFGLVCIGSDRGFVPKMLSNGRGLTVAPGDAGALADLLSEIARYPERYVPMRLAAAEWSQQYSLEGLREAIRQLLLEKWNLSTMVPSSATIAEKAAVQ
jgi:glycosyltransferase involved in cell wall biosynthesis